MEKAILYEPIQTETEAIERNVEKPIMLKELLTSADLETIRKNRLYWISVKMEGKTVYATQGDFVPQQLTTINRDRLNQPVGLPVVMGG